MHFGVWIVYDEDRILKQMVAWHKQLIEFKKSFYQFQPRILGYGPILSITYTSFRFEHRENVNMIELIFSDAVVITALKLK